MATTSQVKAGLNNFSNEIRNSREQLSMAKARIASEKAKLNALPTKYADVIATIDGYTPTGPFETLAKDERAQFTTEFQALSAAATTAETSLSSITEF